MIFSSMFFLWVFLPIVLILYYICPKPAKNCVLLLASLFFYAWGEPIYILLMLFEIIFNWASGLAMDKSKTALGRKSVLFIAVGTDLLVLIFFKYTDWIIETYDLVFSKHIEKLEIVLPIGISFFTFQIISYIVDLYRGKYGVQKNLINLALYISFFPQLIAGPIVRYEDINTQLASRTVNSYKLAAGIRRFIYGLAKKVLIANIMAALVDSIMSHEPADISFFVSWIGAAGYFFQIYFDFSGYSDMAIGLGKMFGFDILENFDHPYMSSSISEFWRRWHISLGRWFREYLYIPLGGNRKGMTRTLLNLFIVFAATGIWHGASWNFLIWGLWHALFIIIERIGFGKVLEKHKFFGHVYSVVVVMLGFVIFRIEDLSYLTGYLRIMFDPVNNFAGGYSVFEFMGNKTLIAFAAAVIAAGAYRLLIEQSRAGGVFTALKFRPAEEVYCFLLLSLSILQLISGTYNPFIYYRF